jgi:hypothetical protein
VSPHSYTEAHPAWAVDLGYNQLKALMVHTEMAGLVQKPGKLLHDRHCFRQQPMHRRMAVRKFKHLERQNEMIAAGREIISAAQATDHPEQLIDRASQLVCDVRLGEADRLRR